MPLLLEGYRLLLHLGDGGMGSVHLARDRADRLVAVKTLKAELADDPRCASLFLREMRVASAIEHPNVATVLETARDGATPFFAMEWVDGLSVRGLLHASARSGVALPLGLALRIAHDACAGLHAAHELSSASGEHLGLVHRDVSPHNLLVSRSGITKVIDFGVAKAREAVTGDTTSSGGLKGKVRYMAPEQARGSSIDRRADIFALGAVLYELVTGQAVLEGPNDLAILRLLTSSQPLAIPADVPASVRELLARALAKRADDRFRDACMMQEAIARCLAEIDPAASTSALAAYLGALPPSEQQARVVAAFAAEAPTRTEPRPRSRKKHLGLFASAAVAAVVIGLALGGARSADAAAPAVASTPVVATATAAAPSTAPSPPTEAPVVPAVAAAPVGELAPSANGPSRARPMVRKAARPRDTKPDDLDTSLRQRH